MMMTINLLPWREMHREALRRQFFIKSIVCFVVVLFVTLLLRQVQFSKVDSQTVRNEILQNEITILNKALNEFSEKEVAKEALERRLELVNALQKQRNNTTLLFNLLPQVMPEGVVLDKVSMVSGKVKIEGRSSTNAQLAHLLARLEEEKGASNIKILSIINRDGTSNQLEKQFQATFKLTGYIVPELPKEVESGS